jgi:hypothetical protein
MRIFFKRFINILECLYRTCSVNIKIYLEKVGKGIHSYRIFNIAIADVILTILAAFIIYLFRAMDFFTFYYFYLF